MRLLLLVSSILCLSLSGCAILLEPGLSPREPLERVPKSFSAEQPAAADEPGLDPDLKMPFVLEVFEELNDGEMLSVNGKVIANTYWNPRSVWLRLSSLSKGEIIGVTSSPLSKLRFGREADEGELTSPEEELSFAMTVPAEEMTDYQLQLIWGSEAAELNRASDVEEEAKEATRPGEASSGRETIAAKDKEPASAPAVAARSEKPAGPEKKKEGSGLDAVLETVVVEKMKQECSQPPCPVVYRVAAALKNTGAGVVNKVSLGVGYVWQPSGTTLDLSGQIPQNEEKVVLSNLGLEPGVSKPLRLLLDRAVPDKTDKGEFRPVLRVTSAEG